MVIRPLLRHARTLDHWLQRRVGRPYHLLLSGALVLEIGQQVHKLLTTPKSEAGRAHVGLVVLVGGLLLVNQLSELAERLERRDARRRERASPSPSPPPHR